MDRRQLIEKITKKKEFSQLPEKDVELAFSKFDKKQYVDEEKVKFTRELLHKVVGGFVSRKLLSPKNKDEEWILRKHLSTRERLPYYKKVYCRIFKNFDKLRKISIVDLGAGINGFGYKYFPCEVNYVGVEAMGQLVDLTNAYFKKNKIKGRVFHTSLFDIEEVKELIKKTKKPRIILLLKMIGPLETMKRDYSKEFLEQVISLSDGVVVSFATETMQKRLRFKWKRNWFVNFVKDNFKILDDFEIGGERYLILSKK